MKKQLIILFLISCLLLSGCAGQKPGTSLEAPPSTAAGDPTGTVKPEPSGTDATDPTNPATDPTATGEAQPTEGQPTETPGPGSSQAPKPMEAPKPTEGQPKPTEAPKPTQAPRPTEAQPKPTEKPQPKPTEGHKHSYKTQTVAATCTEQGYTLHTCSCGDSYKDSYTSATGHSYDSGKVTQAASCAAEGVKTYTCTRCGATQTEAIAKTAHSYVETVVAPIYSAGGYTQHTCSVCGDSYTDNETEQLVFDIEYWVQYTKDLAREMGFIVSDDGEDGYWGGWDDPTIANPARADNGYIENCIRSCLRNYKNAGVKYIWVWAKPNPYTDKRAGWYLYIGYA